jgi:hypothetical protein
MALEESRLANEVKELVDLIATAAKTLISAREDNSDGFSSNAAQIIRGACSQLTALVSPPSQVILEVGEIFISTAVLIFFAEGFCCAYHLRSIYHR